VPSSSLLLPLATMLRWLLILTRLQERTSLSKNAVPGLQHMVALAITEGGELAVPALVQTDERVARDVEVSRRERIVGVGVTGPVVVGVEARAMSLQGVGEVSASPAASLRKKKRCSNKSVLSLEQPADFRGRPSSFLVLG
jgi:hypothetical protein